MSMATVQKTVFRRFNGIDWDSIYFGSSADITVLGVAHTVQRDASPFSYNDVLEANDSIHMLLTKVIDRLATVETERLAALEAGTGITKVDVSKLEGIISRENLPADVSGKGVPVADEAAKDALVLGTDVNTGDIVKVDGGKIYLVTGEEPVDPDVENGPTKTTFMTLADDQSNVAWSRITGAPTTVDGYGITDALKTTDAVNHGTKTDSDPDTFSAADKVAKTNANGKLDFSITGDAATLGGHDSTYYATSTALGAVNDAIGDETTDGTIRKDIKTLQDEMRSQDASWIKTGTINIARIPKAALAELHVIANKDALATLTIEQVQMGDTVKIADIMNDDGTVKVAGGMFYVADVTKLGTADYEDAFVPYTAAAASSVYWSGVMETPTTLAGYGITDGVNTNLLIEDGIVSETNTIANVSGKLAKIGADGKLHVDIAGDAATLGGHDSAYYATAAALADLTTKHTATDESLKDLIKTVMGDGEADPEAKTLVERVVDLETLMGDAPEGYASTVMADLTALKTGTAITELDASKIKGKLTRTQLPADISGRIIEVADMEAAYALTADNASNGDLVVLDNGQVYGIKDDTKLDVADGYKLLVDVAGTSIKWSQITNTPTTLAGYGITDGVNVSDVIENGIYDAETNASVAGKIVKIGTDNKLHADIAGDAATLGGNGPTYYATADAVDAVSLRAPVMLNSVDEFANPAVGQLVIVPYEVPETTTPDPEP